MSARANPIDDDEQQQQPTPDPMATPGAWPGFDVLPPSDVDDDESDERPSPGSSESIPSTEPFRASIRDRAAARLAAAVKSKKLGAGSTRDKAGEALGELVAAAVKLAGNVLHARRTPPDERLGDNDIWIATADEAGAIGAPVGRILARTLPGAIAAAFASTEGVAGDGVEAMTAARKYVATNAEREAEWRAALLAAYSGVEQQPGGPAVDL